jgi:hypothetical protein
MNTMKEIAEANSPLPSQKWLSYSNNERINKLKEISSEYLKNIEILKAFDNGQVILFLLNNLSPGERGELLLNYESFLKKNLDESITLWLEPLGDKNTLRRLRGIEVKK